MKEIEQQLERIFKLLDVKNKSQLAIKLGIRNNTVSSWIKRGKIPLKNLEKIVNEKNTSIEYLQNGNTDTLKNKSNVNNGLMLNGDINGVININTNDFNHKNDIKEIIELLKYAPSGFLENLKTKLNEFKNMSKF